MLNKFNSNRPERKSAILYQLIQMYTIGIAALNEIRFTKTSNVREETDYTF